MAVKKAGYAFLLSIVLTLYFAIMLVPVSFVLPGVYDLVPSTLISEGTILIPALIFMLAEPARLNDMLGFHRIRIRTVLWSLLLLAALYPSVEFANLLSQFVVENAVNATIGSSLYGLPMWEGILLIGVVGPFVEEFIFRGYFYHTFRLTGRITASVLMSGILFGLIHMNLNQALYAAVLGFFFALAVEMTGSTVTSFIMHMVFNSAETVAMYLAMGVASESGLTETTAQEALAMLGINDSLVTVLAFVILFVIAAIGIILAFLILDCMAVSENRRPLFFRRKKAEKASMGAGNSDTGTTVGTEDAAATGKPRGRILSGPLVIGIVLSTAYIVACDLIM